MNEMKQEYDRIVRDKDVDASIRFQRKMMMAFVTGTEYLNSRYDPFSIKLDGWSEHMGVEIDNWDDVIEELYEKYKYHPELSGELHSEMKSLKRNMESWQSKN